jgi:hypothetical protein
MKKTLAMWTLTICGLMNLQATEAIPPSHSIEIHQDTTNQHLAACCRKKHKKHRHRITLTSKKALAGCPKCKDKLTLIT